MVFDPRMLNCAVASRYRLCLLNISGKAFPFGPYAAVRENKLHDLHADRLFDERVSLFYVIGPAGSLSKAFSRM
jgi:hypothetical protein